jgi:hypothetical protein
MLRCFAKNLVVVEAKRKKNKDEKKNVLLPAGVPSTWTFWMIDIPCADHPPIENNFASLPPSHQMARGTGKLYDYIQQQPLLLHPATGYLQVQQQQPQANATAAATTTNNKSRNSSV